MLFSETVRRGCPRRRSLSRPFELLGPGVLAALSIAATSVGQCGLQWSSAGIAQGAPANGLPGTDRDVYAVHAWDPDGSGPQSARIVLGGSFAFAGNQGVNGLAAFDPITGSWSSMGANFLVVRCLLTLPSGDLLVGGTPAAGSGHTCMAIFDGTAWTPIGANINGTVFAATVDASGGIVAGGNFGVVGQTASGVARWDGTSWNALGSAGATNGPVFALTTLPNGDIVIGGDFDYVDGLQLSNLARWDGQSWSSLGGAPSGTVNALTLLPNGDLVAGGSFGSVDGVAANNIAAWNGSNWFALGLGITGTYPEVRALATDALGVLHAVGVRQGVTTTGSSAFFERWDGQSWHPIQSIANSTQIFAPEANAVASTPWGDLVVGGAFDRAATLPVRNAALWNGATWGPVGRGLTGYVSCSVAMPSGDVLIGGAFAGAITNGIDYVARWNGTALGAAGLGLNGPVNDFATLPGGDAVAVGSFSATSPTAFAGVARFDGASWQPFGGGGSSLSGTGAGCAIGPGGEVVVAGSFSTPSGPAIVARWDGANWTVLASQAQGFLMDVVVAANGDILVCGSFRSIDGVPAQHVARFDGAGWRQAGGGLPIYATRLHARPNGDILALGPRLSWFDGAGWRELAQMSSVNGGLSSASLAMELPDGDLLIGGSFETIAGVALSNLARFDGTAWRAFGSTDGPVFTAAQSLRGEMLLGGRFSSAGGIVSPIVVAVESTCPASTNDLGLGCAGNLTVDALPWLGGAFEATASGLPAAGFAVGVIGFGTQALPLAPGFPAPAGCELNVTLDRYEFLPIANGAVRISVPVPENPSLVGVVAYHQVVPVEISPNGSIVAATSTNVLALVLGEL